MSFYEESSIVITPNAYKAGTLYAVVPTSGAADMDVTRATAATRVDESGLVNYAEVIGGEEVTCGDFSCAVPTDYWTATNAIISFSNNEVTVDDTAGAGADSRAAQNFPTIPGKSYIVKFNRVSTTSQFWLGIGDGLAYSNIFYSALGTTTGEYTVQFTATGTSSTIALITSASGITVYSNVSVKQVDRDNVPRIDYTGGGCPHILAEPQSTNLIPYSEPTTNEGAASSITYESFAWAIGFENCVAFGDNSVIRYRYGGSVTNGTEYTLSAYVIMDDNSEPVITNNSVGGDFSLNIGNTVGIGTNNANVSMGNNIWRVSKTAVVAQTTTNNGIIKYITQSSTGFKVVGWQLEEGSYPTSYIPTSGATVTRNQDVFTRDGIGSLINSTEGVLFAEIAALANDGTNRIISLSDGSTTNRVSLILSTTTNTIRAMVVSGSTTFDEDHAVTSVLDYNKIALKYKVNDFALWINGVEVDTDNGPATPIGLDRIVFDVGNGSLFPFFGKVKQLQVYPTALSDSELTILTTP